MLCNAYIKPTVKFQFQISLFKYAVSYEAFIYLPHSVSFQSYLPNFLSPKFNYILTCFPNFIVIPGRARKVQDSKEYLTKWYKVIKIYDKVKLPVIIEKMDIFMYF